MSTDVEEVPINISSNNEDTNSLLNLSSREFKREIAEVIKPSYKSDVQYAMKWRGTWHKISSALSVIGEILIGLSILVAFIASSSIIRTEDGPWYSFVAGSLGTVSRILAKFSDSAKTRSQKKTSELNELLSAVGINYKIPDITDDDIDEEPKVTQNKKSNSNYKPLNTSDISNVDNADNIDVELGIYKRQEQNVSTENPLKQEETRRVRAVKNS